MKKLILIIATVFLFLCPATGSDLRPGNNAIFQLGSERYIHNGAEYMMDAITFLEQNRVYVPVRYLALACGLQDDEVIWDAPNGIVTLTRDGRSVQLQVGNRMLNAGGMQVEMDAFPQFIGGRVYLPARQVAEFFGYTVNWEADNAAVIIYSPEKTIPETPRRIDLILVNKDRPLPPNYDPGPLAAIGDQQISRQILGPLQDLLAAARDRGILLSVNSGYRSAENQISLYKRRVRQYGRKTASSSVALPGHSEHHTGLAVDLKGSSASYRWLEQNCWRHGFILRYPAGRQKVTGYAHEPWHYRYVGIPAATFMHDKKISTLEEYASYIVLQ